MIKKYRKAIRFLKNLIGLFPLKKHKRPKVLRALLSADIRFIQASALKSEVCLSCGNNDPYISVYPYSVSPMFSTLLTCWCRKCGMGWVPEIPFDLNEYYSKEYAHSNRGDRQLEPEEYFRRLQCRVDGKPQYFVGYVTRALAQTERLRKFVKKDYSLLEFGSGPGYALFFSKASKCAAIEPDESSAKYLDYLGVERFELNDLKAESFDAVLSSHSLEHLTADTLYPTISKLRAALKPSGIIYVEVPAGDHTQSFLPGNHSPHTIFFTLAALVNVIKNAGFEVIEADCRLKAEHRELKQPIHSSEMVGQDVGENGLTVIARKLQEQSIPELPERPKILVASGKYLEKYITPTS